jgi:tetratricopeptide (TPR) repeat protein
MAEEEFITLESDEDELNSEVISQQSIKELSESNESPLVKYIILALSSLVIIMIFVLSYLYLTKDDQKGQQEDINASSIIQNINEKRLTKHELTRAQKLIQKADQLYKNGEKEEALKIYEELSEYNQALSHYNIGVAYLKDKRYKDAISSFDKAMQNNMLKCPSAINAGVCGIYLKDQTIFKKYLKDAKRYLPYMLNSPLYSFYLSTIYYYYDQPFESLIVMKNPTSKFYLNKQNYISSKIYTALNNDKSAIKSLIKVNNPKNALTLGLLRAKIGEYSLAINSLSSAIKQNIQPIKSNLALSLVNQKIGNFQDAGDTLEYVYKTYREKSTSIYPISIQIKKSLFDPIHAQKEFKNRIFLNDKYKYSLLFYYAPYQIFNQNQTINTITKGTKKIAIHSIQPAVSYLQDSKLISKMNIAITKALTKINENKIYEAIDILEDVKSLYPTHSTIYYNLGLLYTQIFNFQKAYKYFSKSYSLDNNNYFALTFKAICARLTNKDIPNNDLEKLKLNTTNKEALALIEIANESLGLEVGFLPSDNNAFKTVINLLFAHRQNNYKVYKRSAKTLKEITKSDIVSNVILLDALNDKSDIKTYANDIQLRLRDKTLDTKALYGGGFLAKELYIRMLSIAGINHLLEDDLNKYQLSHKQTISLLQTYALSHIYTKKFNLAYNIYNRLIDEYNQKDSHTLFLAAVAAIGSNHHANAIALLELSKLGDSSNFESKYALGLLYHEAKNLEGASIQYKKIGNSDFRSDYFKFKLKK